MTRNQIEFHSLQEQRRANLAKEQEAYRSNLARELETNRSNIVNEKERERHNRYGEGVDTSRTVISGVDTLGKLAQGILRVIGLS